MVEKDYIVESGTWLFSEKRIINGKLYERSQYFAENNEKNEKFFLSGSQEAFERMTNG